MSSTPPEIITILGTAKSPLDVYNYEIKKTLEEILSDTYVSLSALRLVKAFDIIDPGDHNGIVLTLAQIVAALKKLYEELEKLGAAVTITNPSGLSPFEALLKIYQLAVQNGYTDIKDMAADLLYRFFNYKPSAGTLQNLQPEYSPWQVGAIADNFAKALSVNTPNAYYVISPYKPGVSETFVDQDLINEVLNQLTSNNTSAALMLGTLRTSRAGGISLSGYNAVAYVLGCFKTKYLSVQSGSQLPFPPLILVGNEAATTPECLGLYLASDGSLVLGKGALPSGALQQEIANISVDTTSTWVIVLGKAWVDPNTGTPYIAMYVFDTTPKLLASYKMSEAGQTAFQGRATALAGYALKDVNGNIDVFGLEYDWLGLVGWLYFSPV